MAGAQSSKPPKLPVEAAEKQIEDDAATCLAAPAGQTTAGMEACSAKAYAAYDKLLNEAYKAALTTVDKSSADAIRSSQRAWVIYRNAKRRRIEARGRRPADHWSAPIFKLWKSTGSGRGFTNWVLRRMTRGQRLRLRSAGVMQAAQAAAAVASTLIMTDVFRFSTAIEIARDWLAIATLSSAMAGLLFGDWLRTRSSWTCFRAGLTGLLCLVLAVVLAWEAATILENLQGPLPNGASIASNDFILDAINMKDPGDVISSLEAILILTFGFAGILHPLRAPPGRDRRRHHRLAPGRAGFADV